MTDDPMFIIECPPEKLQALQASLEQLDIDFDPQRDQTYLEDEHRSEGLFTGRHAQDAIVRINEFLAEEQHPHGITRSCADMTPLERHSLLHFINTKVLWDHEAEPSVDELEISEAEILRDRHPRLFQ